MKPVRVERNGTYGAITSGFTRFVAYRLTLNNFEGRRQPFCYAPVCALDSFKGRCDLALFIFPRVENC